MKSLLRKGLLAALLVAVPVVPLEAGAMYIAQGFAFHTQQRPQVVLVRPNIFLGTLDSGNRQIEDPEWLAQGQAVTDPELLRQLNDPPRGYVLDAQVEKLGPGPHILVISDGQGMTRIDYSSGAACQKARDAVRRQTDARLTNRDPNIIYGPPKVSAFCVPR